MRLPQVIHLLDQNNSTWREPLIRTLFPTDMVPHILNIHIPPDNKPDIPVWRQSKDGYYSVKSGYFLAIEGCTREVTVGHDIECDVSKKLRKLELLAKWTMFIWKFLRRILPVGYSLIKRGLPIDSFCVRCHEEAETL